MVVDGKRFRPLRKSKAKLCAWWTSRVIKTKRENARHKDVFKGQIGTPDTYDIFKSGNMRCEYKSKAKRNETKLACNAEFCPRIYCNLVLGRTQVATRSMADTKGGCATKANKPKFQRISLTW